MPGTYRNLDKTMDFIEKKENCCKLTINRNPVNIEYLEAGDLTGHYRHCCGVGQQSYDRGKTWPVDIALH